MRVVSKLKSWKDIRDVFETCFKINESEFNNGLGTDFLQAKNYIVKTFNKLVENERKLLASISKDSLLWESAGGKRLDIFSDVLPLNQLGKIYGIYPFELKNYKYKEILLLLTIEKEQNEIERKFHELKNK